MKIKPNTSFVLVLPEERRTSVGAILLPGNETGLEKVGYSAGRICALPFEYQDGDSFTKDKGLSVGDRVLFQSYKAKQSVIDGHSLIHYTDIIAVVGDDCEVGL